MRDATAMTAIGICLIPKIFATVRHKKTSKEVWDTLIKTYDVIRMPNISRVVRELATIKKGPNEDILSYINRAEELATDLQQAKFAVDPKFVVIFIFGGLPDEYMSIERTYSILRFDVDLPTLTAELRDAEIGFKLRSGHTFSGSQKAAQKETDALISDEHRIKDKRKNDVCNNCH